MHVIGVPKNVRLHAELSSCKRTFFGDTLYIYPCHSLRHEHQILVTLGSASVP